MILTIFAIESLICLFESFNLFVCIISYFSLQEKHSLEHSNSNSSTDSAASSVDSNSTLSSEGSGCGSDGNSNNPHLPLYRKTIETGIFPEISTKLLRAQEFGLSPPSESKLLQRRYREENRNPLTGKKGNIHIKQTN